MSSGTLPTYCETVPSQTWADYKKNKLYFSLPSIAENLISADIIG